MPNKSEHIKQAMINEEFGIEINKDLNKKYASWAVVTFFYSALHWVDAYLATCSYHPADHRSRQSWVSRESKLRKIHTNYRYLEDQSRNARYQLLKHSPKQISNILQRLQDIKNYINQVL